MDPQPSTRSGARCDEPAPPQAGENVGRGSRSHNLAQLEAEAVELRCDGENVLYLGRLAEEHLLREVGDEMTAASAQVGHGAGPLVFGDRLEHLGGELDGGRPARSEVVDGTA